MFVNEFERGIHFEPLDDVRIETAALSERFVVAGNRPDGLLESLGGVTKWAKHDREGVILARRLILRPSA